MKKKKIIIISFSIIGLIILSLLYYFINLGIINNNSKKMEGVIDELKENSIDYVFVDINPSLTLILRHGKVASIKCRNNSCMELKNSLNLYGMELDEAIKTLYAKAEEQGFDTKKGVSVRSYSSISQSLSAYGFVDIEIIEKEKEEELLKETIEEVEVNLSDSEKLLKELEADRDYGEIYSCSIVNEEVECYLNRNLRINYNTIEMFQKRIALVLNRFGIKTESAWEMGVVEEPLFKLYIDGSKFVNGGGDTVGTMFYLGTYECNTVRFNLGDLNLMKPLEIKKHFYVGEHDIVHEPSKQEIQKDFSGTCGDVYCKKHVEYWDNYCNVNTQQWDANVREAYVIYRIDGTYSEEVTKEAYEDFNTTIGMYLKPLPVCEYETIFQNGEYHNILKKPSTGNICKTENNDYQIYYEY